MDIVFSPTFQITPAAAKWLMAIEADRQAVTDLPIDITVLAKLRETARLITTHYSTQKTSTAEEIAVHLGLSH